MNGPTRDPKPTGGALRPLLSWVYRRIVPPFPSYTPPPPGAGEVESRDVWVRVAADPATTAAVVVVLYNPTAEIVENVRGYSSLAGRVYVVDNSDGADAAHEQAFVDEPFVYESLGGNRGIAAGLNAGVRRARADGYQAVLLMDQDSRCRGSEVVAVIAGEAAAWGTRVGIATARASGPNPDDLEMDDLTTSASLATITTGSLLNLAAYDDAGPFRDDLFIDQVDHEFCLRLHVHGWEVLQVAVVTIDHTIGSITRHTFLGVAFTTSNHSPLRKYYSARNRILVWRQYRSRYPGYRRFERQQLIVETGKIALFEDRRREKLRMIWRGIRDGMAGVTGPYDQRTRHRQ